jgi:leucyl-tRNA synthetase
MSKNKPEYKPSDIESYWQKYWEENDIFSPDLLNAKNPYYTLMMFPYPSAEGLHIGNMYAFTGADIHGRYMRMKGKDVFEPIGLDGFGIHSENYALKVGRHPREQAKISEKNFYRQLRATGNAYDWKRTLETYDTDYYRWTQWIFVQMFKKGLAYRKKAQVNWCPSCKTVLADEQVLQKSKVEAAVSVCERCETVVEKRDLEQWFFRITKYADALLSGLDQIDWPEKIKIAQKQWIGRSEGARIKFKVQSSKFKVDGVEVFTTRPDTLFGATFMVLAPEHPIASQISNLKSQISNETIEKVEEYIKRAKSMSEADRIAENKEKTGVFSGLYAINPVNQEKIPVWIADYVLMGYGTGAIMAVPAHDERDFEFAKKYNLPIKQVIAPDSEFGPLRQGYSEARKPLKESKEAYEGPGRLVNSGEWDSFFVPKDMPKILDYIEQKGIGKRETTYHLRDWLISRQRYWGPPIPIIYCRKCWENSKFKVQSSKLAEGVDYAVIDGKEHMIYPVPEEDLPVLLPDVSDWKPLGTGVSPLANHPEFYQAKCPSCNSQAKRETDVSDTFLDSSWYYLRYLSIQKQEARSKKHGNSSKDIKSNQSLEIRNSKFDIPYDLEVIRRWCPVAIYIGGAEHAVLHLLYVRFIAMALHDLKDPKLNNPSTRFARSGWNVSALALPFQEPFPRFFAHGLIIKEGSKMSKSRGNVVIPDEYISKFGADSLRMYLMFLGPFSQGGDFRDSGIEGMHRFVKRLWRLFTQSQKSTLRLRSGREVKSQNLPADRLRMMHKTIKGVTEDIESFSYNTAIAKMMEWYNFLSEELKTQNSRQGRGSPPAAKLKTEEAETFLKLLAPFAPHITEELWGKVSKAPEVSEVSKGIHFEAWPKYDEKYLIEDKVTIVIQVNGKRRGEIIVKSSKLKVKSEIEAMARKEIEKYVSDKAVKNVIYVPGRIINFVI